MLKGAANCTEDRPCRASQGAPCPRCEGSAALSDRDWYAIGFFQLVADQYINQTPMGVEKGPPILTPRLEGYEAALRLHGYAREDWPWLVSTASMLHRLLHRLERIDWRREAGKPYAEIRPEDLDGDAG